MIYETEYEQRCMPVFRIGHFPSESDSETMRKVLKWGVVPLNLKGHGMTPHSLCWARINSPQFIHRFNSKLTLETLAVRTVPSALSPDAENTRTTMSTALTRLLSRFGDDGCRLLPCDLPREIRKIRISGIVSGYGYYPGRR